MAEVKRKQSDGTWKKYGVTPLVTPIIRTGTYPALPDTISPGDWPLVSCVMSYNDASTSALEATNCAIVLPKAGTYRIKWGIMCDYATCYGRLYHGTTALGTERSVSKNSQQIVEEIIAPTDNYEVTLWFRMGSGNGYEWGCSGGIEACIAWPELEEIINAHN